ncbi:hypothetical protein LguiA_016962 [Lonicera macranthoides]
MVDACVGVSSQVNCQRIYMIIYAKMKTITSRDHRSVDLLLQINAIYAGAAKIYSTPPPPPTLLIFQRPVMAVVDVARLFPLLLASLLICMPT